MLAATLPPRSTWYQKPPPPSQRRGRSRNVSAVALARQASEERRTRAAEEEEAMERRRQRRLERQRASISQSPPQPSPLSQPTTVASPVPLTLTSSSSPPPSYSIPNDSLIIPVSTSPVQSVLAPPLSDSTSPTPKPISHDYYSRPPSPPRTLVDRIQVAYAHDNITLAKMLLLQLKFGIEITSTTDPRIDSVKDEDFDEFFVPCGGLKLEEADARLVEEGKRRQKALQEEQQRLERLRACERIWEKEKRKIREEKKRLMKKREEEALIAEARRKEEEAEGQRMRIQRPRFSKTPLFDHQDPGPSTSRLNDEEPMFEYPFMQPTALSPPRRSVLSSPKKREMALSSSPSSVTFKDVVSSMHGRLFPPDHTEQNENRRTSSHPRQSHSRNVRHNELLASLLKVVEWDESERRRAKGKCSQRQAQVNTSRSISCAACCAASASVSASTTSASSSIALSRTNSWLSFGSRVSSTASISTAATTPASSPISSWLKSSAPPSLSAAIEKVAVTYRDPPLRHSCASKRLTLVSLSDCPLSLPESEAKDLDEDSMTESNGALTFSTKGRTKSSLGLRVSLGVSSFVELAKGFQTAYINAAMFSVTTSTNAYGGSDLYLRSASRSPPRKIKAQVDGINNNNKLMTTLKPPGYRVQSSDVGVFTAPTPESLTPNMEAVHFIPLICPFPPPPPSPPLPSRTITTANMKFPPQPVLQPSPYRARDLPTHLVYRMRPVSNPVLLRLRALQNVLGERGQAWEGRGREGGLGCGRERVLGVAFEGRGRSGLGCEVRVGIV